MSFKTFEVNFLESIYANNLLDFFLELRGREGGEGFEKKEGLNK